MRVSKSKFKMLKKLDFKEEICFFLNLNQYSIISTLKKELKK